MEIVLRKDHDNLGYKGEIINVKAGYARNYLIPNGVAIIANKSNRKSAEQDNLQAAHKASKIKEVAQEQVDKLKNLDIKIKVKAANEGGKIFGSVTALQIAQSISTDHKIPIDPKSIVIKNPIKNLGTYEIEIKLHKDVKTNIKVEVIKE
ncbi:MAG: 50S ribosomal protein L9 [Bacteroidetes bacterium]|nr:50S ribosomal protein L9 [Bacteroidota bacterium]